MYVSFGIVAAVLIATLGASAAPNLSVNLVAPRLITNIDHLSITVIVTNTGTETLKVLKDPRGVLSSAKTHTFDVVGKKGSPKFTGMFVKYSPDYIVKRNKPADFVTLTPGQTFKLTHKLAGAYDFTTTGAGEYTFDPFTVFPYVNVSGRLATIKAVARPVKITIRGKLAAAINISKFKPRSLDSRRVSFVGCSARSRPQIYTAVREANSYVSAATKYLNELNGATPRYTTWFGAYSAENAATVRSHFSLMGSSASRMTYDCITCGNVDGWYAFVIPEQPGRIYLCDLFWLAPVTGSSSRAGTIVHELSHFSIYGGTLDYVYGKPGAMALALRDPSEAIMNADSHQFFAENNDPVQP
ncbi:hypothetical protein FRC09_014040 [Ceratobasidium sp. 395]|nr:hypothetical protein FRC09_014040 [Ceratobasidium sp. 395]